MSEPSRLQFLVVGTGRSGTTLVQRLCCELAAVWVPGETHYWAVAEAAAHAFEFPLRGRMRPAMVEWLLTELDDRNLRVTVADVMDEVRKRQERVGLIHIFESLVAAMSPDRAVLGEKTPGHVLWWEQLTASRDDLRLLCVVRDPRAVMVSQRSVPWGEPDPHALAERWLIHQRMVTDAERLLGDDRCLVVRYEDVVSDPDGHRDRIAAFLGVSSDTAVLSEELIERHPLFTRRERWKRPATDDITTDRTDVWRTQLSDEDVEIVEATCSPLMSAFGYERTTKGSGVRASIDGEERVAAYRAYARLITSHVGLPLY